MRRKFFRSNNHSTTDRLNAHLRQDLGLAPCNRADSGWILASVMAQPFVNRFRCY